MSISCIIIEDEPAASDLLERYLAQCPDMRCEGAFPDAFAALAWLEHHTVDLIFLDINLPGLSGIGFLKALPKPPMVIFTTAYPQYAVDGFDHEAVDFLLKPFSFDRFYKAVAKAKERMTRSQPSLQSGKITVKADRKICRIDLDNIWFIESCGDYVAICGPEKKLMVHGTLKSWEDRLQGFSFFRIHRTVIVHLSKIDHIEGNMVKIGPHKLAVAAPYHDELIRRLNQLSPI